MKLNSKLRKIHEFSLSPPPSTKKIDDIVLDAWTVNVLTRKYEGRNPDHKKVWLDQSAT